jgi:hypothetical protein
MYPTKTTNVRDEGQPAIPISINIQVSQISRVLFQLRAMPDLLSVPKSKFTQPSPTPVVPSQQPRCTVCTRPLRSQRAKDRQKCIDCLDITTIREDANERTGRPLTEIQTTSRRSIPQHHQSLAKPIPMSPSVHQWHSTWLRRSAQVIVPSMAPVQFNTDSMMSSNPAFFPPQMTIPNVRLSHYFFYQLALFIFHCLRATSLY